MTLHALAPAGFVVTCFVIGWMAVLAPARAALAARQDRSTALQSAVARARAKAATASQVERERRALEAAVEQSAAAVPDQPGHDGLLRDASELADAAHVRLTRFSPKPRVARPDHDDWPIDLALEGTYPDVRRFFDRLATMPRLLWVTDLEIKAVDDPAIGASITVRCTATAFAAAMEAAAGRAASSIGLDDRTRIDGSAGSLEAWSDAEEERDPFARELTAASAAGPPPRRPATTLAGVGASDVTVTAIAGARSVRLAVLTTGNGRSFVVRGGDHLRDAVVSSIGSAEVTFAMMADSVETGRRELRRPLRRLDALEVR